MVTGWWPFLILRKFGKVVFGSTAEIENLPDLQQLGPDALAIKLKDFKERVGQKKKTIYQTILDQTVLAGVGNIYANDSLWQAKVNPLKPANKLTNEELTKLCRSIKKILNKALKMRGTSTSDYRDTSGLRGRYGDVRLVYQREKTACLRCQGVIKRVKQGGRSVSYCPGCQK